jgi:hypothetical protein
MRWVLGVVAFVSLVFAAVPSVADVTIWMSSSTGSPAPHEMTMVVSIKGQKMRIDMKGPVYDFSAFVDAATKQQFWVNHLRKQVQDFGAYVASVSMNLGDAAVSIKPNGQTKDVLGRACVGYTFTVTLPETYQDEALTVALSGVVWIAKEGPGVSEYREAQRAITAGGLQTRPWARGREDQVIADVVAAISGNGIPMEQETRRRITGSGPIAQVLGKATLKTVTKVTAISVDPIADDLFVVPADYTKK